MEECIKRYIEAKDKKDTDVLVEKFKEKFHCRNTLELFKNDDFLKEFQDMDDFDKELLLKRRQTLREQLMYDWIRENVNEKGIKNVDELCNNEEFKVFLDEYTKAFLDVVLLWTIRD